MLAIKRFYWRLNRSQNSTCTFRNDKQSRYDSTTLCSYIYIKGFDDDCLKRTFKFSKFIQEKPLFKEEELTNLI